MLQRRQRVPGHDLELADGLDFVAEELNPQAMLLAARGDDFQHVAAHAERPTLKLYVVAVVLDGNQLADEVVAPNRHARTKRHHLPLVLAGVAHGVDAADRRDDNHVPPLPKRCRRAVAEAVDFLVDGGVLLDVGVRRCDIRFRLIVIIIGNEIFHRTVGEERPELRAELRRQRLLCAITSVGRCTCAITLAIVNVLPDPVTPSSTCPFMPALTPFVSASIACG